MFSGTRWITIASVAAGSLLGCRTTSGAPTNPATSCVVVGCLRAPADIRIYESDPYASPAGRRIYIGLLNYRERQRIQSRDGRIWYAYRWGSGSAWQEGYIAECRDGQAVELP